MADELELVESEEYEPEVEILPLIEVMQKVVDFTANQDVVVLNPTAYFCRPGQKEIEMSGSTSYQSIGDAFDAADTIADNLRNTVRPWFQVVIDTPPSTDEQEKLTSRAVQGGFRLTFRGTQPQTPEA